MVYTVPEVPNMEYEGQFSATHICIAGLVGVITSSNTVALATVCHAKVPRLINIGAVGISLGINSTEVALVSKVIVCAAPIVNVALAAQDAKLACVLLSGTEYPFWFSGVSTNQSGLRVMIICIYKLNKL